MDGLEETVGTSNNDYKEWDEDEVVVKYGSLSDFLSHICEFHTHSAFICLSCVKVVHISDEQVREHKSGLMVISNMTQICCFKN